MSHDEPCQTIENEETSFIKNNYSEKCRLDIAVTERAEKHNADEHTTNKWYVCRLFPVKSTEMFDSGSI
jgi:hypothetical protein